MKIYNCYSKEVELIHLRIDPLKENWIRHYYDHTGRFYKDYSPEEWEESIKPNEISILFDNVLTEEIDRNILNKLLGK